MLLCVREFCVDPKHHCNNSKGALVDIWLKGNGILVCFAIKQTLQLLLKKSLGEDNNGEINLRRDGEGWPRRMCHRFEDIETWWEPGICCKRDMTCDKDHHVIHPSQSYSP